MDAQAGVESCQQRYDGFASVFANTNFTLGERQYSEGDAVKAQEIANALINNGVVALYGTNGGSTNGSAAAVKDAASNGTKNLCVIIDLNSLQIDDTTQEVMNSEPVDEKKRALGFQIITVDGHSFSELEQAFDAFHTGKDVPTAILMHTTKGKGVSFMENQVGWHGKAPNDAEYAAAMEELNTRLMELGAE